MTRFCTCCGNPLPGNANFCASCRTQVPIAPTPPAQQPATKKPFYKQLWFWLIIALGIAVIGIIATTQPGNKLIGEFYLKGTYSDYTSQSPSFVFKANNKVTIRELAVTYEGTYKVEGQTVKISYALLGTDMVDTYTINDAFDTLTGGGNTYVKKGVSGNDQNTPITKTPGRTKTLTPPRDPVPQEQVESALYAPNAEIAVISHDIDSMIDSVTYKRTIRFEYMDLITTGIIAFEYNADNNEWQRYQAGDKKLTEEENWERLSGQYEYSDSREASWGANGYEIRFELIIESFDGEFIEGSYSYYTRESSREYEDREDDTFSVTSEPPIAGYKSYGYFVMMKDCNGRQPRFTIDRDEGIQIVTSLTPHPVTKVGE